MSGGAGDPAYQQQQQQRGYPTGSGANNPNLLNESLDLSASSFSASSSGTSGIASGEGSEGGSSGAGSFLQQRLASGVSREQGVRDLRSIIQFSHVGGIPVITMSTPTNQQQAAAAAVINVAASAAVSGSQTTGGTSTSSAATSQFQRLKVEDALSYLDQVKLQFGNQPQVYNDFLDIMKEFKSQSIDTPGVISRVSNLFKGHPDLIVGFNTFLPPGFKIEVHQNEINISGPAQHSQTLAKIAQAHNSSQAALNAASSASAASPGTSTTSSAGGSAGKGASGGSGQSSSTQQGSAHQPVEFNHAINYVNKIKNRFQHHPDIYKAFLEILHKYQKEQRILKEGGGVNILPLTESEVYSQVSSLFQNQEDLLSEFSQFLPEATAYTASLAALPPPITKKQVQSSGAGKGSKGTRKTSQSGGNSSTGNHAKKPKNSAKDVLAEAGKHLNYVELSLFDNIRKFLHNPEVHDNFLRCLMLFNEEIISRHELVQLVTPFLGKFPELFASFKTLLGFKDPSLPEQLPTIPSASSFPSKERVNEFAAELDYKNLKRHGASYRALPKTYAQPKCSGRTALCREVLNDTWVSFPMWSEDSTFEGTRKTQFEEYIFRCEDERFELDVVLEMNLSTIRYLEAIHKKMAKMSPDEISHFSLDDSLAGQSEVLQRKAIYRIYGEKASDIIDGLKKSPSVAVPIVLKRLKAKQEEWREAQRSFNKTWHDQLEKYYLKSLDHQGINFKQVDTRAMRSKSLIAEIEAIYDERQEQMSEGASANGPHLVLPFPVEKCIMDDAVGLIMYYTKIASSLNHADTLKIRAFLTHTLPDLLYYPRVEISKEDDVSPDSDSDTMDVDSLPREGEKQLRASGKGGYITPEPCLHFELMDSHVIFASNSVYTFFRLLQFLCDRLNRIYQQALRLINGSDTERKAREAEGTVGGSGSESVAVKLGMKKAPDINVEQHYPTYLSMAKNFMEGNIDSNSYEDTCREMFGVHAYVVFTIDRLIQNIVRQVQTLVTDDNCFQVLDCYSNFIEGLSPAHLRAESRVAMEMGYQGKVEALLNGENCFKIIFDKADHNMSVELLDTEEPVEEPSAQEMKKWHNYVEKYTGQEEATPLDLKEVLAKRKIFLKRSLRPCGRSLSPGAGGAEEEPKLEQLLPSMVVCGTIEFKMDKKSYRMIPLANSEDYLYNMSALTKAKQVNPSVMLAQREKWLKWHSAWSQNNLSPTDKDKCSDWLLGVGLMTSSTTPTSDPASVCTEEEFQGQKVKKYRTSVAESAELRPEAETMETS